MWLMSEKSNGKLSDVLLCHTMSKNIAPNVKNGYMEGELN